MSNPFSEIPSFQQSTKASRARSPEKISTDQGPKSIPKSPSYHEHKFITSSVEPSFSETETLPVETPSPEELSGDKGPPEVTTTASTKAVEVRHPPPVSHTTVSSMGQTKIRGFKGLRDGKEDPSEYLEDIEWAYEQDYENRAPAAEEARVHFHNKTHRILFRQHLEDYAFSWYSDLKGDIKQDWPALQGAFLPAFVITVKDAQTKKFELRVKLANLQQVENEAIADYLKRASELALKLPQDGIDVGMATLKGMHDVGKRERVSFECNKDADYSFANVLKLLKAAYHEIGKANPFDPTYKDSLKLTVTGTPTMTSEELMRQVLINTNQAFPALVQGMRNLQTSLGSQKQVWPANQAQIEGRPYQPRPKRDISEVECFVCRQKGHYASVHSSSNPQAVAASAAIPEQYQQCYDPGEYLEDDESAPVASQCLLVEETTPAMAATKTRKPAAPPKAPQILQRPKGVQKTRKDPTSFNPPELPQFILDQIRCYGQV